MQSYVLNSLAEIEKIKDQWNQLYFESCTENPFLCWEWNRLWISSFTGEDTIRVVVVEDEGKIIGIAPFYVQKSNLTFLADSLFADYMDILVEKPSSEVVDLIFQKLVEFEDWNRLDLLTIPETSNCLKYFQPTLAKYTISSSSTAIHLNPYITISGNFDDYIASRSNGIKKELRRSKNKLDKTFDTWEFFEADGRLLWSRNSYVDEGLIDPSSVIN